MRIKSFGVVDIAGSGNRAKIIGWPACDINLCHRDVLTHVRVHAVSVCACARGCLHAVQIAQ